MFGGGGALSYDLDWLIGWSEFSVRAGGDFLLGNGTATQVQMIETELVFEKGVYLGTGFEMYFGLGPTFSLIRLRGVPRFNPVILLDCPGERLPDGTCPADADFTEAAQIPGQVVDYNATRFGATALLGFELLLSPNFAMRAEFPVRGNIPKQGYDSASPPLSQCPDDPTEPGSVSATAEVDSRLCWGFQQREDLWLAAGARLGAKVMF
jgi:hypothetical protein